MHVLLQHVDLHESTISGLLKIQGLTIDNPSLTTYFEGEIVGPQYSFLTKKPEWGATERVDLQHWTRFSGFRPVGKSIKKADQAHRNFMSKEYIFMRWKELGVHHAGSPDPDDSGENMQVNWLDESDLHQVLDGVSFAGFYYICFHQPTGNILGMYYAENSELYQQLTLQPRKDGRFQTFEFR